MMPFSREALRAWDRRWRRDPGKATTRILFDLPNAFSAKAVVSVALELVARGHQVRVTGRSQRPGSEWAFLPEYPQLAPFFIHRYWARMKAWDAIVFTDGPSASYLRWALRIRFPHGPGEGLYSRPHSLALAREWGFDVILCNSTFNADHVSRLDPRFQPDQNVFSIGWPCLDALLDGHYDRDAILDGFGLPRGRKTVLVTSHWTPASLLRSLGGAEVLGELARLPDVNLVLTAHNHLWHRRSVRASLGSSWYQRLEAEASRHAHVRIVRSGDVRPLLACADVLVGDRSSVSQEYSVLERPILQFIQKDHAPSNKELDALFDGTVDRFSNLEDLAPRVQAQLLHPDTGESGARKALVDRSFSHLGHATARAADVIEGLARQGGTGPLAGLS